MRKFLTIVSMLMATSACATDNVTIMEYVFDDNYQEIRQAKISKPEELKVVEIPIDEDVVVQQAPQTYRLQTKTERYEERIPVAEIYAIPAERATNKFLDETRDIYEQNGSVFLYITALKKEDRRLPDGIYKAEQVTKKIIDGADVFKVVGDMKEADYILETSINNIGTVEDPIIEYKMILMDTDNKKINEWTEVIRRVYNDDHSWW